MTNNQLLQKDNFFKNINEEPLPFSFNNPQIVTVFDDMVHRSVPMYVELQQLLNIFIRKFAHSETNIYDLGCSTGNTLIQLDNVISETVSIIGVDNSKAMLSTAQSRIEELTKTRQRYHLMEADISSDEFRVENASVVILNLTLQFVRPVHRKSVLTKIYKGLRQGGILLMVEKIALSSNLLATMMKSVYYDFKQDQGYTKMEIEKKRQALEDVLVSYTLTENLNLLHSVDFHDMTIFFAALCFIGIVAVKT